MRHDGRIKQGRGFQGVFGKEIGADKEPPGFGGLFHYRQGPPHLLEAFQETVADLLVALGKLGRHLVQQLPGTVFGKRQDSGDDSGYPLRATRTKGPQENPGLVGTEYGVGTFEVHGYWAGGYSVRAMGSLKLVTMFCANCISARERRKARVDSAPWFPLTRSTCSPSRHPPVSGE